MNRQYSQKLTDILEYSREEAGRLRCDSIGPEHLLLALLRDGDNAATELLNKLHADLRHLKQEVESDIERCNTFNDTARSLDLNAAANKVMRLTLLEARVLKQSVADAQHLLLALLKDGHNMAADVLSRNEVSYDKVFDLLSIKSDPTTPSMGGGDFFEDDEEDDDFPTERSSKNAQTVSSKPQQKSSSDTPVIDNFSVDMTRAAAEGKMDPVIGRDKEIERLAQILSRRRSDVQLFAVGKESVGVELGDLHDRFLLALGALEHLILARVAVGAEMAHVGDIHNAKHVKSRKAQVSVQHVLHNIRTQVANVSKVVYCGAAGVHFDLTGLIGNELVLFSGE